MVVLEHTLQTHLPSSRCMLFLNNLQLTTTVPIQLLAH
jgi:hypothetical protein